MKFQFKILYIFLILSIIFSVSCVVANEEVAVVAEDMCEYECNDILEEEIVDDGELLKDTQEHSFTDLAIQIDTASNNITIGGKYSYDSIMDSAYQSGISINKDSDFKVIGNNLVIDGKGQARAFKFNSAYGIELNNITFINCHSPENGGAIYSSSAIKIVNCEFKNNYADLYGGAIYCNIAEPSDFQSGVNKSNFNNNRANLDYSAIYWKSVNVDNFDNNNFTNHFDDIISQTIVKYEGNKSKLTAMNFKNNIQKVCFAAVGNGLDFSNSKCENNTGITFKVIGDDAIFRGNLINNSKLNNNNFAIELTGNNPEYSGVTVLSKKSIETFSNTSGFWGTTCSGDVICHGDLKSESLTVDGNLITNGGSSVAVSTINGNFICMGDATFYNLIVKKELEVHNETTFYGGSIHQLRSYGNITCRDTQFYRLYAYNQTRLNDIHVQNEVVIYGDAILNGGEFDYNIYVDGNLEIISAYETPRLVLILNKYGNITFNLDPNHNTLNGSILCDQDGTGRFIVANDTTLNLNDCRIEFPKFINNGGEINLINTLIEASKIINNNGKISYYSDPTLSQEVKYSEIINNGGEINVYNYTIFNHCNLKNNEGTLNLNNCVIDGGSVDNDDQFIFKNGGFSQAKVNNNGAMTLNNIGTFNLNIDNKGTLNLEGETSMTNSNLVNSGTLNVANETSVDGLTVSKINAKVTVNKLTMYYGASKYLNIKVTDANGNPVGNTKITININKKNYYATTKANGVATLKVPILNVGSYTATIKGDNPYYNIASKTTVKVIKAKTTVKAPKVTVKAKKSKYFKVTVKSKVTKKAVNKLKIKVKVYTGKKYKVYKLKTNKKGVAKLNTKKLKKGKHKVVITSLNKNYSISKKSLITIK